MSRLEDVAAQMVDTLRGVLLAASDPDYPWQNGALKRQIREDLTEYEALGLDLDAAAGIGETP